MNSLGDHLGNHWLALTLLVIAAGLFALRYSKLAMVFALFSLGGLLFTGVSFGMTDLGFVSIGNLFAGIAIAGGLVSLTLLSIFRKWSFTAASLFGSLAILSLGAFFERELGGGLAEWARALRGLQFVRPWWLVLLALVPVVVVLARRSLSGLGPLRKWLAISLRAAIITALVCALAEPRFGRPTNDVTVLYVIDRSLSVPQELDPDAKVTEQQDKRWLRIRQFVENSASKKGPLHTMDSAGVILFGKRPKLALPPSPAVGWMIDDRMAGPIDGQYTDIAAALKLAVASFPEGSGRRIVLISDGNENLGNAEEQAAVAKQNGVQIDTVALAPGYRNENEVLVQSVEAPKTTSAGVKLPVRVLVRNASPTRVVIGLLELLRVGPDENGVDKTELLPIDADNPDVVSPGDAKRPATVRLKPGLNAFRFRDKVNGPKEASYSYRSVFTPIESANENGTALVKGLPGDRVDNNKAGTVVITRSQRKVLFIDGSTKGSFPHGHLIKTLQKVGIDVVLRPVDLLDPNPEDFLKFISDHDCIVLADVPAEALSFERQEAIRTCVHDQGCGLVMIGGPDAYGPGGYQGTPVEAALPVDCEIKALKAAGRGGLILIMHASEMADGNKWQKDIAKLAVQRLNPNDMVGLMQYGFGGGAGVSWVIPFREIGDGKQRMLAAIDGMTPGDMPDFDPFLTAAVDTLIKPEYNLAVKHTIIISDGDPQYGPIGQKAVKKMADNQVTCTTVGVATHSGAESGKLKSIAAGTKDGKGQPGSYYEPKNPNELPGIYIKESRRISQSFIYDKPFSPQLRLRSGPTEGLPNKLPELKGFVRTTLKESALVEMMIEGPRMYDQKFPILATWQYGLGKAVAFTSDARTQPGGMIAGWDVEWASSDVYQRFWEQAVGWAMRAAEKGKMTIMSDYKDGRVKIIVEARDDKDRPVGGLEMKGGISLPRQPQPGEKLPVLNFKKKGAGVYEAEFPVEEAGSYFVTIQGLQPGAGGKPTLFDYARTGVTVPYSQEFADLETNTPLLKRLSEITGGDFHTEEQADLDAMVKNASVYREAPKVVRAIKPFWFWLVFAAGVILLFDVGIRRVSLEWTEVNASATRLWTQLRSSRELAVEGVALDRLKQRKLEVAEALEKKNAARRFDPTLAPRNDPAPAGADELITGDKKPQLPAAPPIRETPPKSDEPTDMLSKLKQAKKRANFDKDKEG
ncbi:VWA domain-containing protein [soil metagenome]